MSNPDSAFFVFDTRAAADEVIRMLGQSGFDIEPVPLGGTTRHVQEKPIGFHNAGDLIEAWGGSCVLARGQ